MEFRVADFEKLSYHFKVYQDGLKSIELKKNSFLERIEPFRREIQQIISTSQSGIVLDNMSEEKRAERFKTLQEEILAIDKEAKYILSKEKDDLTKEVYSQLEEIISNWAVENSVDIVIGKLEIVYMNDKYEITNDIIDILKEKNLYIDDSILEENEKESV